MMVEYRVPMKEHIKEGTNTLLITFPSTFLKGKQLEKEHGKFGLWNGDASRLHVRKAQYKSVTILFPLILSHHIPQHANTAMDGTGGQYL